MKKTLLSLIAAILAGCSDSGNIGTTHIVHSGTDEKAMRNLAVQICPLESETPCQVILMKKDTAIPTTIPLTDEQVNDVLMYFAVDNSLEYDAAELIWNCHVFGSLDEPDTKHPTCITPEMLNKLLAPYHAK